MRTVFLYAVVIAVMRMLGKRQIGELEPSELVITILVSELAAVPMQNSGLPLAAGLVPIAALFSLGILTSVLTLKSPWLRKLFYGKPSVIIRKGEFVQSEIRRLRLSADEISEELRLKKITDIKCVKYGIIETNGQMSIIEYSGDGTNDGLPVSLICNGRLMKENLKLTGMSKADILKILRERNIDCVRDVFYMCRNENGTVSVVENKS
ncbi:MAG: YetF domain-containing protein [Eubacteriales bacterium]